MHFSKLLRSTACSSASDLDQSAFEAAWQQGKAAFAAQAWQSASQHFQAALLVSSHSSARRRAERQLRRCRIAQQIEAWHIAGQEALSKQAWSQAAQYFRQIAPLYESGLGLDRSTLKAALRFAERGYQYQTALGTAREAKEEGLNSLAQRYYAMALEWHHPEYGPTRLALEAEYSELLGQIGQPTPWREALRAWPVAVVVVLIMGGLVLGLGGSTSLVGKGTPIMTVADQESHTPGEIPPSFPGGKDAMQAYLRSQLTFPHPARQAGVSGHVIVRFRVEVDGTLSHLEVKEGIGYGCSQEALRVVQGMPRWIPGQKQQQPTPMEQTLAIRFEQS